MKRSRDIAKSLVVAGLLIAAGAAISAPARAGQNAGSPAPSASDATAEWASLDAASMSELAGGTAGTDFGIVIDDIQLNASNTTATVAGNTISGFDTGQAFGNSMSDIHGFGNTMVINTGVLTMSNSVNVNVSVDMAR